MAAEVSSDPNDEIKQDLKNSKNPAWKKSLCPPPVARKLRGSFLLQEISFFARVFVILILKDDLVEDILVLLADLVMRLCEDEADGELRL